MIQQDIPLRELTWMKVGGTSDFYAEVKTREELFEAFQFTREQKLPIVYLGQGSNLIVPDQGIRGLVLRLMNDAVRYDLGDEHASAALVTVEGGKILSRLIHESRKKGLNGLDNFVGIPGVVGAAVRGNIGIPASEFGELVKRVEIFDGKEFRWLSHDECIFRYRGSHIKDKYWLVWQVELIVNKGKPPQQDDVLLSRIAKQPKGHSCGSFFKNPEPGHVFSGKLIEECGLKGKRVGGAVISEKHGNFLMNDGSATAKDIVELARQVKAEVLARKGIVLENEVLIYDEKGREIGF